MKKTIMFLCITGICSGVAIAEKDRYDIRKLQNDPEVLVSVSKHPSHNLEYVSQVKKQIVKDDVVVYASIEDSVTGEETLPVICESKNDLITCDVF